MAQFHCVVVMGDLNYRIDFFGQEHEDKPNDLYFQRAVSMIQLYNDDTKQKAEQKETFDEMLKYDQLNVLRKNEHTFIGFNELDITFPPTFKLEKKEGINYINKRLPAWCDRILWQRCNLMTKEDGFEVSNYKMYKNVSISDHKPVSCLFKIPIWPRICGISDDCQSAIIEFRNLMAMDLIAADSDGKSDPFIHFPRQLLLGKFVQSKCIKDSLNPIWKEDDVKPLKLIRNNLLFLSKSLLLFQIRDHDETLSLIQERKIGYSCIEMNRCVKQLNEWVPFRKELVFQGKKAGVFQGQIRLKYEAKQQQKVFNV